VRKRGHERARFSAPLLILSASRFADTSLRVSTLHRSGARTMLTKQMQTPSLGQKVRSLREEKGITLRELSRRADVSPSFVCDLEAGRRFPSPNNLRKLADALGVVVSDLADLDHRQTLAALKRLLEGDPAWGELFVEILRAASEDQVKPERMLEELKTRK